MVNAKSRIGDLEVSLINRMGHHGAALTVLGRNCKYTWLAALTAETTRELIQMLAPQKDLVRTIRAGNGKEF